MQELVGVGLAGEVKLGHLFDDGFDEWKELLGLGDEASAKDFIAAATAAGDSVMTRLWTHVKNDGGMITEQIDRNTGKQISAKNLTWSFGNILHALKIRKGIKL